MPLPRKLHIAAFAFALSLWTWALLDPNPVPEPIRSELDIDWQFILSKFLHGGGYAFLTVLGGTLVKRGRWAFIAGMALHGAATEVLQATMELGRHGCIRDVLIDWAGILAGTLFLYLWPARQNA